MKVSTLKSLPAVCRGLGVIECKINVESCGGGTVDKNKCRMKHSVENNSSSQYSLHLKCPFPC